jgi:hypothetical protein
MKINEIVSESKVAKLRASVSDNMPGVFVQKQLQNTDTYMQYRYGMAVASARAVANGDVTFSDESAFGENLTHVAYVPQDEETIKLASKLFGVTPTQVAKAKSKESNTISKLSPVPKKKKNKYGV